MLKETIKDEAKQCLKDYKPSRNCDGELIWYWLMKKGINLPRETLHKLKEIKTLIRYRRKIQNEDYEYEPNLNVKLKRGVLQKEHAEYWRKKQ